MRSPVMYTALSFALGILVGEWAGFQLPSLFWWGVACTALAGAMRFRQRPRAAHWLLMLSIVCMGIFHGGSASVFPDWLLLRAPELQQLRGRVVSYPHFGTDRVRFVFQPHGFPGRLQVYWYRSSPLLGVIHYGDEVELRGSVQLPEPFEGFDYPRYLARRGIFARMIVEGDEEVVCERAVLSLLGTGDRLRQSILRRLEDRMAAVDFALAQSLLFGDRSALPERVEDAFSRTGLMHLLAVSGLHLGIFLGGFWWGLRRLGVRPRFAYPIVGIMVLVALWIVGPRVSLVRAGLLFGFLALGSVLADFGVILRRWVRPLNALAAAAIVILVLRPGALFEAGFQLTISATAAILLAFSPEVGLEAWLAQWKVGSAWGTRVLQGGFRLLAVSAAAQAGAAPIIVWHFGTVHPLAIAVNGIVVPLAGFALWSGFLAIVVSGTFLLPIAIASFSLSLAWLRSIVEGLARIAGSSLPVPRWVGPWLGTLVVFVYLVAIYSPERSSWTQNSMSMVSDASEDSRVGEGRPR